MREMEQVLETYGSEYEPEEDINFVDAIDIIKGSFSKMEMIHKGYEQGYICGKHSAQKKVPLYNIPQISDERWNELAKTMGR